jgi:enoyl-CoA hydratase
MVEFSTIEFSLEEGIGVLTVRRPEALNALSLEVLRELEAFLDELDQRTDVGALIITGAGEKAFVAGADIRELLSLDPAGAVKLSEFAQGLFNRIENLGIPAIAAVNGYCLGGGCELALACHLRIAATSARFGQPEVKLGIIPGFGATQRLPRLIGSGRACEMLLTGEMITAETACEWGLVNRVVTADRLLAECRELAQKILANSRVAVRGCLGAVRSGREMALREGLAFEGVAFGLAFAAEDSKEGMTAFLEKRPPRFKGK